jgi:hypothetical protein
MITRSSIRRFAPIAFLLGIGGPGFAQPVEQQAPPAAAAAAQPFVRVVDAPDGTIELQVAIRTLNPPVAEGEEEPGPVVYLAGAVHIADQPFYDELQEFLDSRDVVLFEGVKPPGTGRELGAADDAKRATQTEHRLRFLATAAVIFKSEHKALPSSMEELATGVDRRLGGLVAGATADAWGNPIELVAEAGVEEGDARVDFVSRGADGRPGGDGPDADLRFSDQDPLSAEELGDDEGIQTQLASALGLVFQKDGMDWAKPNWRNSDLSVDEIMDRLDAVGADGSQLFGILQGGTFSAKLAGFVLKLIGLSPTSQTIGKLMIAEMLGQAEELLMAAPGMDKMMEVIIRDRNAVVVDDLRRVIREEPEVRTVGIIYGAGHLIDLEERIVSELGYTAGEDRWLPAITVDIAKAGMTPAQVQFMRDTVRKSIRQQIDAAKKVKKKKGKPRIRADEPGSEKGAEPK